MPETNTTSVEQIPVIIEPVEQDAELVEVGDVVQIPVIDCVGTTEVVGSTEVVADKGVRSTEVVNPKTTKKKLKIDKYKRFKVPKNLNSVIKCQRIFRKKYFLKKIEKKIKKIFSVKRNKFIYEPTIFGIENPEIKKQLEIAHIIRQIQMKEGAIAQVVLGNFYDWEDLEIGHESGLDIRKKDNSAIIELKNKWNTCNSGSAKAVLDKLSEYKKKNPDTRCIWGVINPKNISKNNSSKFEHNGVIIEKLEGNELLDYIFTYKNYNYKSEILNFVKQLIHNLNL